VPRNSDSLEQAPGQALRLPPASLLT